MDTNRLISGISKLKGDGPDREEAFRAVYEESRGAAMAAVRRYCDDKDEYEDILQETYLQVYRSVGDLRDEEKALAWICRIAANTALRHTQKNRKQQHDTFSDLAEEDGTIPDFEDVTGTYNPETIADRKAVSEAVAKILDSLPQDQRTAMWMVYGQQVTVREFAAALGVSENTVKSRLYQGRNKLLARKDEFRKYGVEIAAVPLALLIASAFEDTVYAAAPYAGNLPKFPGTPDGRNIPKTKSAETVANGKPSGAIRISGGTASTAGKGADAVGKAAGAAGRAASAIGKSRLISAFLSASAGVKAAVTAGAAIAVIGTSWAVSSIHGPAGMAGRAGIPAYMAPIEYKVEAYNNRSYGLKETIGTFYPSIAVKSAEKALKSRESSSDSWYLELWENSSENMASGYYIDSTEFDSKLGENWRLEWEEVSAEPITGEDLDNLRNKYTRPLQLDPRVELDSIMTGHGDDRKALEDALGAMEITEAMNVTFLLSGKGSIGWAQEEKDAIVVKMGKEWVLYQGPPLDFVLDIGFRSYKKAGDSGDGSDRMQEGSGRNSGESAAIQDEANGDTEQDDIGLPDAGRTAEQAGEGENVAGTLPDLPLEIDPDTPADLLDLDNNLYISSLMRMMAYSGMLGTEATADRLPALQNWADRLYAGDWGCMIEVLDIFDDHYQPDTQKAGLDELVYDYSESTGIASERFTAAQIEYIARSMTAKDWRFSPDKIPESFQSGSVTRTCPEDYEAAQDGLVIYDYSGKYSEATPELIDETVEYIGGGKWTVRYSCEYIHGWPNPVTDSLGYIVFTVISNPDSCFDGFCITKIETEPYTGQQTGDIPASAEAGTPVTLRMVMDTSEGPDNPLGNWDMILATTYKYEVETASDGAIIIEIHDVSEMGLSMPDLLQEAKNGIPADILLLATRFLWDVGCYETEWMEEPYAFNGHIGFRDWTKTDEARQLLEETARAGLGTRGLFFAEDGFSQLFLREPDGDMNGKIIAEGPYGNSKGYIEKIGGTPVSYSGDWDAMPADGAIDGMLDSLTHYTTVEMYEYAPYIVMDYNLTSPFEALITLEAEKKLPEGGLEILRKAGVDAMSLLASECAHSDTIMLEDCLAYGAQQITLE